MNNVKALLLSSLAAVAIVGLCDASAAPATVDTTAKPCGPNLIANGSFEHGTTPGSYLTIKMASNDLDDWSVTKGTVDVVGTLWPASDGVRSIDLDGVSFGAISQNIKTDPGKTYVVTFDLSGNGYGPPTVKAIRLSAGSDNSRYTFDMTKRPYHSMGWQTHTWRFVAGHKSTTITFESLDTENGYFGPILDNVHVQATSCD